MAGLEGRTPRQRVEPLTGEHEAVCLSAERSTSAAGNACVRWTFDVRGTELAYTTVVRRKETGLCAQALGMQLKPLILSRAAGRKCRLTVEADGPFLNIRSVRPL